MRRLEILETCLYVEDLLRARKFYADFLQLEIVQEEPGRHLFFRSGERMLLLFNPAASSNGGEIPDHGARGPMHLAFGVAQNEMAGWRKRLSEAGVKIEKEVEWPNGGTSLYFRDPAGNSLELASPRIWNIEEDRFFNRNA